MMKKLPRAGKYQLAEYKPMYVSHRSERERCILHVCATLFMYLWVNGHILCNVDNCNYVCMYILKNAA